LNIISINMLDFLNISIVITAFFAFNPKSLGLQLPRIMRSFLFIFRYEKFTYLYVHGSSCSRFDKSDSVKTVPPIDLQTGGLPKG
jgi:hypothetical protein